MSESNASPGRPATRPAGVYVPRHRRPEAQDSDDSRGGGGSDSKSNIPGDGNPATIIRRGRGAFEAPSMAGQQQQQQQRRTEGLKSAREYDATTLRQYPPDKPAATTLKEKSKSSPGKSGAAGGDVDSLSSRVAKDLKLEDDDDDEAADEDGGSWEDLAGDSSKPVGSWRSNQSSSSPAKPQSWRRDHWEEPGDGCTLECSGFPASWKTYHLEDAFSEGGTDRDSFRIKWVNDTCALIIFRSNTAAKQAYAQVCTNPFFKVTPFKGKLDGPGPSVNEARPVTSDVVARRLISGALGLSVKKRTPEERAAEEAKLKEAQGELDCYRRPFFFVVPTEHILT